MNPNDDCLPPRKPGFLHGGRNRSFFIALGTLLFVCLVPWLYLIWVVLS